MNAFEGQHTMKLWRGRRDMKSLSKGCVATIGNFDGVHLGHQQLLSQVKTKAGELGVATAVILFEPHPTEFFLPEPPARLMTLREKLTAIRAFGIDHVLVLRFNAELSQMSAEEFIACYLVQALNVRHLVIGDDFRFGHKRSGDFALLAQDSRFTVSASETFMLNGERVSSTAVRLALANGQFELAAQFIGRQYGVQGVVAHGEKRGRLLGFPTANIRLHRKTLPLRGVYAVVVNGLGRPVYGVANFGARPTVNGVEPRCEVHLFNFAQDIYRQHIEVVPKQFIRSEQRFDGLEALKQQIHLDAEKAKAFFALSV